MDEKQVFKNLLGLPRVRCAEHGVKQILSEYLWLWSQENMPEYRKSEFEMLHRCFFDQAVHLRSLGLEKKLVILVPAESNTENEV